MALAFDSSRAPMGEAELAALVRAVVGAGDGDEGHWIEWKSALDLGSAQGKASVIRCVLGMANRDPDLASRYCEGRGYMVVGAEPGRVVGLAPADPADLTAWWTPFLGADGPRWEPHWVQVDGKDVLVVEVAAPRAGDLLHAARKATTGIEDGDVFVRGHGRTARATSAQLAALVRRAGAAPTLSGVAVALARPAGVRPVAFDAESLRAWAAAAREECLSSLPKLSAVPSKSAAAVGRPPGTGVSVARLRELEQRSEDGDPLSPDEQDELSRGQDEARQAIAGMSQALAAMGSDLWSSEPESRSPDQYRAEAAAYESDMLDALPAELLAAASRLLEPCVIELRNETDTNLPDVRLVVHVPGDRVLASDPDEDGPGLPAPPRPYGPRKVSLLRLGTMPDYGHLGHFPAAGPQWRSGVDIDNGGSATLTFDPVHLRPRQAVLLPPVVLLLAPGQPVVASWEATSTGLSGVAGGTLVLPVSGQPLTVEEALRPPSDDS